MERQVKERLVGATLLVALIVLIVPELLSGPRRSKPAPPADLGISTRSVSVDLATSRAVPQPSAADSAASSAASAPSGSRDADSPSVATLRAQGSEEALESGTSSPRSARETMNSSTAAGSAGQEPRGWAVQLGSFASKLNADKLVRQLRSQGGSMIYVVESGTGVSLRYRVRMGPLADRSAAERAVAKLKAEGHAATIVTPSS